MAVTRNGLKKRWLVAWFVVVIIALIAANAGGDWWILAAIFMFLSLVFATGYADLKTIHTAEIMIGESGIVCLMLSYDTLDGNRWLIQLDGSTPGSGKSENFVILTERAIKENLDPKMIEIGDLIVFDPKTARIRKANWIHNPAKS